MSQRCPAGCPRCSQQPLLPHRTCRGQGELSAGETVARFLKNSMLKGSAHTQDSGTRATQEGWQHFCMHQEQRDGKHRQGQKDKDSKDSPDEGLEVCCPENTMSCNFVCTDPIGWKRVMGFLLSEELMCLQMTCLRPDTEQGVLALLPLGQSPPVMLLLAELTPSSVPGPGQTVPASSSCSALDS